MRNFLMVVCVIWVNVLSSQEVFPFKSVRANEFELNTEELKLALQKKQAIATPFGKEKSVFKQRSNFESGLAQKYPQIKSYVSDDLLKIYLDEFNGEYTFFRLEDGGASHLIRDGNMYKMIRSTDEINKAVTTVKDFCRTTGIHQNENNGIVETREKQAENVQLRTYRIAISLTGEFSRNIAVRKDQILAGLNSHLTRINAVYIKENAIEFKLINKNDTIIFTDPNTDPFTNGSPSALMEENVTVLNDYIGLQNFDIGHVFGTNTGGVALLRSVCTANKAAGSSSTFGAYNGINFYLIPCHEIGHQFSAEHSFNLCDNSNESSGSAFEPGSGSTIMSYAGASQCDSNYIQNMMDPYFHTHSLRQIKSYSRSGTGSLCGTVLDAFNKTPDVQILSPQNIVIPIGTPFEIEGIATDDKNLGITYNWEQMDLGIKSTLGNPTGSAPLFRSVMPANSPVRSFPTLQSILDDKSNKNEVLPNRTRPLNFRLTARDQDSVAGGVGFADIMLSSTNTSGPFRITNFNTKDTLYKGDFFQLTWDVANTDNTPVNVKSVDVYWSSDGGVQFTKIANNLDNDGSEWLKVPDGITSTGRVKIKASNSIFFDINNANLIVVGVTNPKLQVAIFPSNALVCTGQNIPFILKSNQTSNLDTFWLHDVNAEKYNIKFSKNFITKSDSVVATCTPRSIVNVPREKINFLAISKTGNDSIKLQMGLETISNLIKKISPGEGANQISTKPLFKWEKTNASVDYKLQVSDSPVFSSIVFSKTILPTDSVAIPENDLKTNSIYFWRIIPVSVCNTNDYTISTFHTQSLECKSYTPEDLPKFISATGMPRVVSSIDVKDTISLALISIPVVRGSHDFIGDLVASLKAPSGDSIILWSNECNNLSNFNIGLDDQAALSLTCPLTDRKTHMPKQTFASLLKSTSAGKWSINIQDTKSGSGGSLDEWSLQLCGSVSNPGPRLFTNVGIKQIEKTTNNLSKSIIEYTDSDSNADVLKYVLLQTPSLGYLVLNGQDTIRKGQSFTQAQINKGLLSFITSMVREDTSENIQFIVQDEKNNWSGIQLLKITVLNDATLAQKDQNPIPTLFAYPNPFKDQLNIRSQSNIMTMVQVLNLNGQLVLEQKYQANEIRITTSHLPAGIYLLKLLRTGSNRAEYLKVIKH